MHSAQRYFDGFRWTDNVSAYPGPSRRGEAEEARRLCGSSCLVVVLFFGGCAVLIGLGASDSSDGNASDSGAPIGSKVSDGKFSFTVSDVSPATTRYGDPQPRGQWVIATMTVTNEGNEPQSFFAGNQKLIDTNGREYAADTMAAYAMNRDDAMTIDVNPGFTIGVKVPFDVPPGTDIDRIELHDSAFSDGVSVKVGS